MPQIGTSGSMSGEGKRSDWHSLQATAPLLDSTRKLCRGKDPSWTRRSSGLRFPLWVITVSAFPRAFFRFFRVQT